MAKTLQERVEALEAASKPATIQNPGSKTLKARVEELEAENDELQSVVTEYEEKFDAIAEQLPEPEEEGQEGED